MKFGLLFLVKFVLITLKVHVKIYRAMSFGCIFALFPSKNVSQEFLFEVDVKIKLDVSCVLPFLSESEINVIAPFIQICHNFLHEKTGLGNEFTGWLDYPLVFDDEKLEKINEFANRIRFNSEIFIVIGVGGSYLGSRAAIQFLGGEFFNLNKRCQIFFAGHNLSAKYLQDLTSIVRDKDFSINVISKSGTTLEPSLAFCHFKELLEKKYGSAYKSRIYVTTDVGEGLLRRIALKEDYEILDIPCGVGGRYSVLTPVGLLLVAVGGYNIRSVIRGALTAFHEYSNLDLSKNECYNYAALRHILSLKLKSIEVMVSYEPELVFFVEWFKQLFGESGGKNGKGVFPAGVNFTSDLHSLGQWLQDGPRNVFETILHVKRPNTDIDILDSVDCFSEMGLNKTVSLNQANECAFLGARRAHFESGVPNFLIEIEDMCEESFGQLVYFFEKSCAIGCYLNLSNPFDQPGVEEYKKNMFRLLGQLSI